jgi:two-component system nitrogen regulation response regulator NtrX
MAPETVEQALFGIEGGGERGTLRIGALEEAHGGTLLLDEVADMPLETQGKILRVLIEQNFLRVGGGTRVSVDVRIISSTSRDLQADIASRRFREDLFHRLNVVPLRVPSLAERREDIPDLIEHFMDQIGLASGLPRRIIAEDALAVLQSHDWPGNVRQLRNNVERLLILAQGDPQTPVTADMLPQELSSMIPPTPAGTGGERLLALPLREAREVFEREYLAAQISRFGGNVSRTAEFIGMERSALHRKLKSLRVGEDSGVDL